MISWVTVVWSMVASACLTLAVVHALFWSRRRGAWANLLFALAATVTTLLAADEVWMMRAETPELFATAMRWYHVPVFALMVLLVGFVRLYLRAGRRWLAWAVCTVRALSLALNFLIGVNLNFRQITAVRRIPFLGEPVSIAVGVPNPWMLVGQLSLVLLLIFIADAALSVWRRGDRRQAVVVGGGMLTFVLLAGGQSILTLWGIVPAPVITSLFYLGIVAAMAFELSRGLFRAAELSDELRESEERMLLAAEAANLSVWVWDIGQDEIWMTERGRTLIGFPPTARLDCAALIDCVHPEDRATREAAIRQAIATKGDYENLYRVLLQDGSLRWIGARGRYLSARNGHAARLVGVSIDVTAQKQAQEALRESESRFSAMANSAPVMIWMSGPDKLCTYFNSVWLDFTGRTPEQESGHGWAEGVHREDFDRCLEIYVSSFDSREPFTMEYRLRRRDGEYRWILDSGTPRFADKGEFLGYIGSCVDITERKQTEAETARQRNELGHLSRVALVGELAASLAHELNQPLNAIVTNASAALRFIAAGEMHPNEFNELLADIVTDGHRAGEVIRGIKGMVRKDMCARAAIDLNAVISDVLRLVRSDALAHGCALTTDRDAKLPPVLGDAVQLQQVLLNLIINAFDAMRETPSNPCRVEIQSRAVDLRTVEVSVRDFGPGLPAAAAARIFESFFSTKRDGMGMGLAIARSIIEAHAGTLAAENAAGGGARFWFRVPAQDVVSPETPV